MMARWLSRKMVAALAIGLLLAMAVPWAAFASSVDVTSVVDVTAPTGSVTLAPGGSGSITINLSVTGSQAGTATFEVFRTWLLSGGTFTGSNPQEFTVNPRAGSDPATTFSAPGTVIVGAGQTAGTFTLTAGVFDITNSNATGAKLAAGSSATYSVTVSAPTNTPPTVSVSGVTDGASYEIGSVPAATCNVTDAEDTGESATPSVSAITGPLAAYGLGSQTASCSYTDGGGLTRTASATYTIVDTGKPVITDNSATSGPDGANGWYISAVTNEFEASDSGAGFAGQSNPHTFNVSSGTAEGSAVTISSGTVTDVAGNTAAAISSAAFKIDLSNPTDVAFLGGIAAGGSYGFSAVPAEPTCTADDAISGLDTCVVTGYSADLGAHTLTATATDNAGRTATATLSYTVDDDTAPVILYDLAPSTPDGDNGWYRSDVSLTWTVTEDESPDSLVLTGCDNQNITADQSATTYSCAAESDGGSAGPITVEIKRDATAPEVAVTGVSDGATYDFGTVPAAGCSTTDATSGVATSATASTPTNAVGANTVTCSGATDNAGNAAAPVSVTYTVVDPTPPVITPSVSGTEGDNGWYTSNVTVTWTVSDLESGISSSTGCDATTITTDTAGTTLTCSATSAGGSSSQSVTIKRDATAPVVTVTGVANGASYYFGAVPAAGCTTTDAMSGVATSATASTPTNALGANTVICSGAKDNAGNTSSASVTYTVLAWKLSGFYQPVDMNGVLNTVKGGSTVPLKFEVFKGATGENESTNVADIASVTATKITCDAGAVVDDIEITATGGTSLRYDATAGQFVYNWQTPKTPGVCYAVTMKTLDGTVLTAKFKLK